MTVSMGKILLKEKILTFLKEEKVNILIAN